MIFTSATAIVAIKQRRMTWVGNVARVGERRGAYRILMGTQKGKRPQKISRRRWDCGIETDLKDIVWEG
jgi:hypothetical protein